MEEKDAARKREYGGPQKLDVAAASACVANFLEVQWFGKGGIAARTDAEIQGIVAKITELAKLLGKNPSKTPLGGLQRLIRDSRPGIKA